MKRYSISIFASILIVAVNIFTNPPTTEADAPLSISYIDVGQGDSILIRDPDGTDILIDGGTTTGGEAVVDYLRDMLVDDVDIMLATHADADHIGGLIDVLNMNDIPVVQVLYNGYPGTTTTWNNFVSAVASEGITLTVAQYPQELTWGAVNVSVLNPIAGLVDPETNEACVVVLLTYGTNKFLFTCDIDNTVEAEILIRGSVVSANVLKVAHHGSKYASSAEFLSAVGMDNAVISVGENGYGHPAQETIDRLIAAGATVYRTDQDGTVVVTSDGANYAVTISTEPITYTVYLPVIMSPPPCTPPSGADFTWTPSTIYTEAQVAFSGSVAEGTEPRTYAWNFGDGGTAAGISATHKFTSAGSYNVQFTVSNSCGSVTASHMVTVIVQPPPCVAPTGPGFTWTPTSPEEGETVNFAGSVAGGTPPLTWSWNYGDGGTGNGQNVTHAYATAGNYQANLTISNACGQAEVSHTITVTEPPPPPVTGNIQITYIFYNGAGSSEPDEYVEIRNMDTIPIQVSGWTLADIAGHRFTFPSYVMESGKICRIYTNQVHPEWCGFSYGSGSAIWNNTGDTAYLRDGSNTLIDQYTYP